MAKDEPSYKLMRELDDLKDKYNKLLRDQRILVTVKETLEDNLKETFANLKDEQIRSLELKHEIEKKDT